VNRKRDFSFEPLIGLDGLGGLSPRVAAEPVAFAAEHEDGAVNERAGPMTAVAAISSGKGSRSSAQTAGSFVRLRQTLGCRAPVDFAFVRRLRFVGSELSWRRRVPEMKCRRREVVLCSAYHEASSRHRQRGYLTE
jgi:hypothetical protein